MFDADAIESATKALGFPVGTAVIHASAAMVLYGLLDTARDIDISADERGWQHALTLGTPRQADIDWIVEPSAGIEVFSGWLGEPLEGLFGRARTVRGVLLAAPEDILSFKLRLNRPKDQEHIRLLRAFTCNNH